MPSTVSAIKVDGRRAYDLVRAGEDVELPARARDRRRVRRASRAPRTASLDLDVVVDCSSGTYIRALARDLGAALGVGGHLTALRRTRVGPFDVAGAAALDATRPDAPARRRRRSPTAVLGALPVSGDEARDLRHGKRLAGAAGRARRVPARGGRRAGALVGIVEAAGPDVKSS